MCWQSTEPGEGPRDSVAFYRPAPTKRKDIREARSTPAALPPDQELPKAELFVTLTPGVPNLAAGVPLKASLLL